MGKLKRREEKKNAKKFGEDQTDREIHPTARAETERHQPSSSREGRCYEDEAGDGRVARKDGGKLEDNREFEPRLPNRRSGV